MKKFSNTYIFIYITVLVIVVAILLSIASVGLQSRQEANRKMETYMQILMAAGYSVNETSGKTVIDTYRQAVDSIHPDKDLLVLKVKTKDGNDRYVIPVEGKGLWGPLWGYIAIASDGNTITGAIFAHKSETPGLGAEIDKPKFADEFKGKQLFDKTGEFVSVKVLKGGVANSVIDPLHGVDAITGGTITSKGVDKMLQESLQKYVPFFKSFHQ